MRLLLIEDNPLNIELFAAVLEGDGHELVIETDGIRGRDRALAESFDVLLIDIQLPGLPGDQICRELRAAGVVCPILALSASAMPEQVARGLAAGFNDYLTKPISTTSLRAAVREYGAVAQGDDQT